MSELITKILDTVQDKNEWLKAISNNACNAHEYEHTVFVNKDANAVERKSYNDVIKFINDYKASSKRGTLHYERQYT